MLCSNQLSYVADVARIIRARGSSVNPWGRNLSRAIKRLEIEAEVVAVRLVTVGFGELPLRFVPVFVPGSDFL